MAGTPPKPSRPKPGAPFDEKLRWLVAWSNPAGQPWKVTEIHSGLMAQQSQAEERGEHLPGLSQSYLSDLINGKRPRPGSDRIESLAKFFGVPVTYFFQDEMTSKVASEIENLQRFADTTLEAIYTRAEAMSPKQREAVLELFESFDVPGEPDRKE